MSEATSSPAPGVEESERILDRMFQSLTTRTGTDEQGNELRYPGSMREIRILRAGSAKLDRIGCQDPGIVERRRQMATIAEEAPRRQFSGSAKLLILTVVAVLGLSYCSNPLFNSKQITEQAAKTEMESRLEGWKSNIVACNKDLERGLSDSQKVKTLAHIREAEDTVRHLESITPQQYMEAHNSSQPAAKAKGLATLIVLLCFPFLYFLSARAPLFLLVKRRKTLERWKLGWGFLGGLLVGILGFFSSMPITTTITHWSDGSRTEDSNAGTVGFLNMIAIAAVVLILLFVIVYVLPLMTLVNLIRNYGYLVMEKIRKEPDPSFD